MAVAQPRCVKRDTECETNEASHFRAKLTLSVKKDVEHPSITRFAIRCHRRHPSMRDGVLDGWLLSLLGLVGPTVGEVLRSS